MRPALALTLAAVLLLSAAPASAGDRARTAGGVATTSARWAAVARATNGTSTTGKLSVAFGALNKNGTAVSSALEIANVGQLPLLGTTFTTTSTWSGTSAPTLTVTVRGCVNGTWNLTGTPTCVGGTLVSIDSYSYTYTTPVTRTVAVGQALAVGARLPICITVSANKSGTAYTVQAGATVSRAQVRAAITRQA